MIAKQQHNRLSFAIDVELYRDVVVIDSLLVLAQVTIIEILKNITAHSRKICPSYFIWSSIRCTISYMALDHTSNSSAVKRQD